MTQIEQAQNAKEFAEFWKDKGDEKQHTQSFWTSLLREVYGVSAPEKIIDFEKRVKIGGTKFIDAYLADTRVAIEQKGTKIDLDKPEKQSDGTELSPFGQAKRYNDNLPFSEKCRWIVVSNFTEFRIHDMEKTEPEKDFETVLLKDLEKDYYRLQFLVDQKNENIRREEEISIQAGKLVGKLYDAIMPEYICHSEKICHSELVSESKSEEMLKQVQHDIPKNRHDGLSAEQARSLNILCVRIVFCLYAEDAGLFETRASFEDYIKSFNLPNLRTGIINLFKALDTKIEDRDKYDETLKPFPYVNGGLFKDEQIEIPNFTQKIVDVIVNECAPFNWSEISPTIFGAVFESTLNPETRRKGGMHYTSIANIHKVIDPLFMDDLNTEFEAIVGGTVVAQKNAVVEPVETTDTSNSGHFDRLNDRRPRRKNLSPKERTAALHAFQKKLGALTFLDPACGSGNFLTETYLSLRRLENRVISLLNKGERAFGFDEFIKVHINQFYGIEINDFAVTVAKTALWIAESQMVAETEAILSQNIDFLPLTNHANIVEGNALRLDWATLSEHEDLGLLFTEKLNIFEKAPYNEPLEVHEPTPEEAVMIGRHFKELNVVAKEVEYKITPKSETPAPIVYDYIMGNPPFSGAQAMDKDGHQKRDILDTFTGVKGGGNLDYVCCWYKKAADYIRGKPTRAAFVSTSSIVQGEQVAVLWKPLFADGLHIDFAYRSFKWYSESTDMAHVHCVIIAFTVGIEEKRQKFVIDADGTKTIVNHINAYLLDMPDVFIESRGKPLCEGIPAMNKGSQPTDNGNLIITADEYDEFVKKEPSAKKFIREFIGSDEFIKGKKRYCLWFVNASPAELRKMPLVAKRIEAVKKARLASTKKATNDWAAYPYLFTENRQPESGNYLLVPSVSSERRQYVPIGFMDSSTVTSNLAFVVPNANLYHFGILTSRVHNTWMRAVCGRLESRYRYSNTIVYNNFPWCNPTDAQKAKIEEAAQAILDARANHPESTLADLYDETFMPPDLRKAHEANDKAVMSAYGFAAKMSESEIVAELFKMYERLTRGEK